jgi:hypothetical protein
MIDEHTIYWNVYGRQWLDGITDEVTTDILTGYLDIHVCIN